MSLTNEVIAFSPKPEDLRFFSDNEAIVYARNAGFTVQNVDRVAVATRADMPKKEFHLIQDKDKPDRLVWIEV